MFFVMSNREITKEKCTVIKEVFIMSSFLILHSCLLVLLARPRPEAFQTKGLRQLRPVRRKGVAFLVKEALKVHKIEIFFGFDFEICIISLLVM